MNIGISFRQKVAGAGIALTLVTAGCAMMAPKAEHYVAPPLGSTWTQVQNSTGSYGSGSTKVSTKRGERTWQGQRYITFEGSTALLADSDGNWVGIVSGDKPIITWDPPIGWDWPLEVGKSWAKTSSVTIHAAKKTIPFKYTGKVEAYEDVTVQAGTFKAFKISSSNTLGDETTYWFSPELGTNVKLIQERTAQSPSGPGTRETQIASQTITK